MDNSDLTGVAVRVTSDNDAATDREPLPQRVARPVSATATATVRLRFWRRWAQPVLVGTEWDALGPCGRTSGEEVAGEYVVIAIVCTAHLLFESSDSCNAR